MYLKCANTLATLLLFQVFWLAIISVIQRNIKMLEPVSMAKNGPLFSSFIQGYWRLTAWGMSVQERLTFLKQHLDLGITTIDHADIYGNYECERLFGEALKCDPRLRDQMQIVTKCGIHLVSDKFSDRQINHYDSSYGHIVQSVDNSLTRLGIEHIDLLLIHRPDFLMDADEVASAFEALQKAGKVTHFGVSNFTPFQFDLLQSRLSMPLVTNQVEINPLQLDLIENGTLDQLQMLGRKPMAWSCLAGGDIFNKDSDQIRRVRAMLEIIKEQTGASSIEQVIFAWVRMLPSNPLPILGSGNIERVKNAIGSLDIKLNKEQWYQIWAASKGHGVA